MSTVSFEAVNWDVTSRCNLCCKHCAVSETYQRSGADCSPEEAKLILRRLRDVGCDKLWLVGGEPLLRKDIVDIVADAKRLGYTMIRIVSNGTRLTSELADRLLDAGLDDLMISLDGPTAEVNDRLRGEGAFAKAIRGLEIMLERREARPRAERLNLGAQLTLARTNLETAPQMARLAGEMAIERLYINELVVAGGVRSDTDGLLPTLIEAMDAREAIIEAAAAYPEVQLHVFGRPRAVDYFNERYGLDLPQLPPSCALDGSYGGLVFVEASGLTTACSAVHYEEGAGSTEAEAEPARLQHHAIEEILNAPRFDWIKEIVRKALDEGWQDRFIPCGGCPHRAVCQICPLTLQEKMEDGMIRECLLALQRLSRFRKEQRSAQAAHAAAAASHAAASQNQVGG